jgi:hypothetical protein
MASRKNDLNKSFLPGPEKTNPSVVGTISTGDVSYM